ncbi:hypothetical protein HPB51_011195 [Rhipicephalus microplus]|uniref:Uncharacterized protein n=1 Tax=Rhipicephalus microplus TaxID=6941 RepID=A0A9J6F1J0_RHIMP|nr:hypothetical protein HPB51_011195 [Rhipicephalus microplus]
MDVVAGVRGRGTTRRELLSASGDGVGRALSARAALSSEIAVSQPGAEGTGSRSSSWRSRDSSRAVRSSRRGTPPPPLRHIERERCTLQGLLLLQMATTAIGVIAFPSPVRRDSERKAPGLYARNRVGAQFHRCRWPRSVRPRRCCGFPVPRCGSARESLLEAPDVTTNTVTSGISTPAALFVRVRACHNRCWKTRQMGTETYVAHNARKSSGISDVECLRRLRVPDERAKIYGVGGRRSQQRRRKVGGLGFRSLRPGVRCDAVARIASARPWKYMGDLKSATPCPAHNKGALAAYRHAPWKVDSTHGRSAVVGPVESLEWFRDTSRKLSLFASGVLSVLALS